MSNITNKSLSSLLAGVKVIDRRGGDVMISDITTDSRKVADGCLFIAVKGTVVDGHDFIVQALEQGAVAIVADNQNVADNIKVEGTTIVIVENSAIANGVISSNWMNNPSEQLTLIGVTGTNGKTTIATLLYEMARLAGEKAGLISTVANYVDDKVITATHTTPDPLTINTLLRQMVDEGCTFAAMEVSSHAAAQHRIAGLTFAGGIFTNLTRDHLDYHHTVEAYRDAKKSFFDSLPAGTWALTNKDDRNGSFMLQNCRAYHKFYSIRSICDFNARPIEKHLDGTLISFNGREVFSRLVGEYNVSNLAAVFGASVLIGWDYDTILTNISRLKPVAGRFQTVSIGGDKPASPVALPTVIVDYAHTPDALENVLNTIRDISAQARIYTVVGAGGNRDKGKRPIMASLAAKMSDFLVITSDNPRKESPVDIINDMVEGLSPDQKQSTTIIVDRRDAIADAIGRAQAGDVVLIAGKGHETYQEIDGVRHHFDDREEARKCLLKKSEQNNTAI